MNNVKINKFRACLLFFVGFILVLAQFNYGASVRKHKKIKQETLRVIDQLGETLSKTAKQIWDYAEVALIEFKSSQALMALLQKEGFKIDRNIGGLKTAFTATYGEGPPVIGILGEFDALPGLSQKAGAFKQEPVKVAAPGHGCGHNIFGVGSAGAAIALKKLMIKYKLKGTVRFFGCPAEETVEGKVYMARDGAFSDLDICLDWHPSSKNQVSLNTSNALNNFAVMFYGRTSHAAGDPWNGRSALDGLELLNIGLNYLREHVKPTVRIHYVIPEGGKAPNIVPDYAEGWYYVRGKTRKEVEEVYQRVLEIIKGAALMSETKSKVRIYTGVYNYLKNKVVAELLYKNLRQVGPPAFTKEDQQYAKKMQKYIGKAEDGMSTRIETFTEAKNYWGGGSTDAADVSWIVPTASLNVACWPLNVPGHSWCVTSASGSATGFKGMLTASKVLALTALDIIFNPAIVKKAKKEFLKNTRGKKYKSALAKDQKPRIVK